MRKYTVWDSLMQAVFPDDAACFACNRLAQLNARYLCEACEARVHKAPALSCPPALDGLYAGLIYTEALHNAMHRFKYGDARYLSRLFAAQMHLPFSWEYAYILPVPLHKNRLRERGYNQSALLAKALIRQSPMELYRGEGMLSRVRDTAAQAEKSADARRANVEGAFLALPQAEGKRFVLVDDVYTTGSTLTACAKALKLAGAQAVYGACACVVLKQGE